MNTSALVLYTDGACLGNPGPGGWAALILGTGAERAVWGADPATTNQRMELRAVLEGLRALEGPSTVTVCSDSTYVINGFREQWHVGWVRRNWRNSKGQPVANRELWEAVIAQAARHAVTWTWVRGHAGDPLNERADALATRAAREQSAGSSSGLRTTPVAGT